jgi:nitric oxide reductase activation protein
MPFPDKFEDAGFSAGDWQIEEGHFPWFNFDEIVMEFLQVLYDNDWVTPQFNWTEWQESAKQYVDSREMVEPADAVTIQKLLTTHARADRFCEGHLASMFENEHILAMLQRLKVLRAEMDREEADE